MTKLSKIIRFAFIFLLLSFANADSKGSVFLTILKENGLEFKSKSIKGWLRVINNESKQHQYGLNKYSTETLDKCKEELKKIQLKKIEGGL